MRIICDLQKSKQTVWEEIIFKLIFINIFKSEGIFSCKRRLSYGTDS